MKTPLGSLAVLGTCLLVAGGSPPAEDPLDALLPVRGLCIAAPNPAQVDAFVRFIDEELAPRSLNTLILRWISTSSTTSRPELGNRSGLSPADVKKLVEVCRTHDIRLIPQINLLDTNPGSEPTANCSSVPGVRRTPGSRCRRSTPGRIRTVCIVAAIVRCIRRCMRSSCAGG